MQLSFTGNNTSNNNRMDSYSYDSAGNLLYDNVHHYFYDAENRLIQVDGTAGTCASGSSTGTTACYYFDAEGRRVHRTGYTNDTCDSTGKRDYVFDLAGHAIVEFNSTGTACYGYLFVGNREFGRLGGGTYFTHTDWLGTMRLINLDTTPTSGAQTCTSLPFGDGLNCNSYSSDVLHFTGKERDSESGLDNFEKRYNASSMGRFMSPDPANFGAVDEYPQTWNAYSYVTNNPLNATDPNGLDCIYAGTASDNPNPGGAGTVTVVRGDCVNAGGKNDSGTFVNGTVDTDKPITSDAATGDLTFGLTNDKGAYGTGIATNFSDPQSPGSSGQLNPFAQGVFSQINKMPIMKGIGVVYGASVLLGVTGGAACYYLCPEAAATGALTGEAGTYGIESTNTLNQIIGGPQRELLKEFFETGKAPEGLSQRTLQIYKDIAQRAVAAGKDQLGVQAQRIQMISNALK